MDFVRLAKGLKGQTSELIPANENIYSKIKNQLNQDWYVSLFSYTKEHAEAFKTSHSVAGIRGLKTNRILFDFDAAKLEDARVDALEAAHRLIAKGVPEEQITVYFSGNKGFHVEFRVNEFINRQEFVNIVFGIAGDLKTFDQRINDEARVIRLPLSQHPETKLYKIPLAVKDLETLSVDSIKEAAQRNGDEEGLYSSVLGERIDMPVAIFKLKAIEAKKLVTEIVGNTEIKGFDVKDIDFTQCPKWLAADRYALSQGFFYGSENVDRGERNTAFLILAATFKNQGFSAEHTLALLEVTAEKQALRTKEDPYSTEQLTKEIINVVFSPTWKGGQFSSDEPLLQITRERFGLDNEIDEVTVEGISDVGDGFKNFAKNLNNNRILIGLPSLDQNLVLTTGMLATVVSAPGGGKTALANLFAETVSKENNHVLYFSLDLYKNLLFSRMLQRYVKYDIQKIFEQFENEEPDESLMSAYAGVLENYSNVGFSFKSSSIDDIEKEIQHYTKRKGVAPKLIIVDYLDKVRSAYTDPTQSSAHVAGRLSDISKKYNTLVLLMAQPSKFGSSGPNQEFTSYRALKGSSSIESDSRIILGISRPGYDPNDMARDVYSSVTVLKNNTGKLGRYDFSWDGLSGTFNELNADQRHALKKLREELANKPNYRDDV